MARKPFLPTYKGQNWSIGMGVIRQRPDMLLLIADAITMWPFIEHYMAMSLGLLLGSNTEAALAVFATLRTGRNQRDAITAAAEARLNTGDQELVAACLSAFRTAEKIRNDLAHGNWGVLGSIPTALIWVEAKHHAPWNTAVITNVEAPPTHGDLEKHFYVYTDADLREQIAKLEEAMAIARNLFEFFKRGPDSSLADPLRELLSSAPPVRQALDRLAQQKSTRPAHC